MVNECANYAMDPRALLTTFESFFGENNLNLKPDFALSQIWRILVTRQTSVQLNRILSGAAMCQKLGSAIDETQRFVMVAVDGMRQENFSGNLTLNVRGLSSLVSSRRSRSPLSPRIDVHRYAFEWATKSRGANRGGSMGRHMAFHGESDATYT